MRAPTSASKSAVVVVSLVIAQAVRAQPVTEPTPNPGQPVESGQPPTAGYPEAAPPETVPPPVATAQAAGTPASSGQPPRAPPGQGTYPPPAERPPASESAGQPTQVTYTGAGYGYGGVYEPPPPPPPKEPSKAPAFAVRVDPLNALLAGRMGLELEVQVWKFITIESVPTFVVWQEPPSFNFVGRDTNLRQESHGIGALSGVSIGPSFWLEGKPFRGYVLRAVLTNYSYRYVAYDPATGAEIDAAAHVERVLGGFFGSYSKIGIFTIGGGIGLGVELNRERRCFDDRWQPTSNCPKEEFLIALSPPNSYGFAVASPNGGLYPVYLEGRLSLGFVFEP
jgi:hypothetical protein